MKMKNIYTIAIFTLSLFMVSCGGEDKQAVVDNTPAISVKVSKVESNGNNPFLSVSGKNSSHK